jgi:hypothetical protein
MGAHASALVPVHACAHTLPQDHMRLLAKACCRSKVLITATGSNGPRDSAPSHGSAGPGRRCHCHHYYKCEGRPRWPCACQWRNGLGRREPASHCPATARRPRPGLRLCRGGDVTVPSLNPPERPQARGEPRVAKTAHFKLAATGTRSRRPLSAPVPVTCTRPPALGPGPASPRGPGGPGPAGRRGQPAGSADSSLPKTRPSSGIGDSPSVTTARSDAQTRQGR